MPNRLKSDKRVIFPPGQQNRFLLKAKKQLNFSSWALFAKKIRVHRRTLSDWKGEEYSLPLKVLKRVCKISGLEEPSNIETKEPFWYVSKGARVGGLAVYKKYGRIGGDPEYRKKKWREWWEKEGRFKQHPIINEALPIKKPRKSVDLAEFVGIVLGDGNISKGQVTISLNDKDDKEYSEFVVALIKKLFDVPVGTYHRRELSAMNFIISRSELVRFCVEKLELKRGNKIKQQVDIPDWIKQNNSYSIGCVRGLVDTDGCVFTHRYKVNRKWYSYKKLVFTSYSKPLRRSMFNILKDNGFNPRLARDRDVHLDSIANMERYFKIINFHNPKHLKRYLR